jgi:hypothetical protein
MAENVTPIPADELRAYRAHWQRVGPILARIRRRELRALTDEQHQVRIGWVMELARPETALKRTCGLIEFYRRMRVRT